MRRAFLKWFPFWLAALLLLGQSLGAGARPVQALAANANFVVNNTADAPDVDPADGICAAANGACTLRAAIMSANFTSTADTVALPAGTFTLTRAGLDDGALVGDLDITAPLTIQGAGEAATIVDGNGAVTGDRVFEVLTSAQIVTLKGLTIRNGKAPSSDGGGIRAINTDVFSLAVTLDTVILEGNSALNGGGLSASGTKVGLQSVIVRNNQAATSTGGGILVGFGGLLTMRDSQEYGNHADVGGGLTIDGIGNAQIERSQIYSNTADAFGGAIYNTTAFQLPTSPVTIVDSSLHDNSAAEGGGIYTYETLTLTRTTVDANQAQVNGGGIYVNPNNESTVVSIEASTLSNNHAQFGGGLAYVYELGGSGGRVTITNSTVSGNLVNHDGAGIYAKGFGDLLLNYATVASNILSLDRSASNPLRGGGLFADTTRVSLGGTLIADNDYMDNLARAIPDDCFTAGSTALTSLGWNLIETTSNCAIGGDRTGNLTGLDPKLEPLRNNFGPTKTQALRLGSSAIDEERLGDCLGTSGAPITTDQRGFARPDPIGDRCDVGAYEYYPVFSTYLPLVDR